MIIKKNSTIQYEKSKFNKISIIFKKKNQNWFSVYWVEIKVENHIKIPISENLWEFKSLYDLSRHLNLLITHITKTIKYNS